MMDYTFPVYKNTWYVWYTLLKKVMYVKVRAVSPTVLWVTTICFSSEGCYFHAVVRPVEGTCITRHAVHVDTKCTHSQNLVRSVTCIAVSITYEHWFTQSPRSVVSCFYVWWLYYLYLLLRTVHVEYFPMIVVLYSSFLRTHVYVHYGPRTKHTSVECTAFNCTRL